MSKNVVIIGGHGKVALRLTRLLSPSHKLTSVIRSNSEDQIKDVVEAGSTPFVLSLEDDQAQAKFTDLFNTTKADVVFFTAGAGYRASEERTKKIEYEAVVNVLDAIENSTVKPRFLIISAVDIRDPTKVPEHYNEDDKKLSERMRQMMPAYFQWRYEADKNLVARTAFKWTILRPGGLTEEPGAGKASIGKTHLTVTISRDDLASILAALLDREDASGFAIDTVGGSVPIAEGLDAFIARGETDWIG
ncbi:hypothetical protein MD484_g800, partial [Candolleomyces efflorescens]